jgi:N-acetylglucosamine malate deacetylase 2
MPGLLALFAHPDDETYRCGGTLALLVRRGVHVQVVTATRGEAGSCGDPPLCQAKELGAVREAELRCACQALGIAPPLVWDYIDGALNAVNDEQAIDGLLAQIRALRPDTLLTWPPHGLSGHPDHQAVSRWATAALHRAAEEGIDYPTALYYLAVPRSVADTLGLKQLHALPDEEVALAIDVMPVWEYKMAAIRCHRSQQGESPILRAPEARQRLFLGTEHLQRAASRAPHDVFASLSRTSAA